MKKYIYRFYRLALYVHTLWISSCFRPVHIHTWRTARISRVQIFVIQWNYNKVLGITNDFPGPVTVEYVEKNLDTTKTYFVSPSAPRCIEVSR